MKIIYFLQTKTKDLLHLFKGQYHHDQQGMESEC